MQALPQHRRDQELLLRQRLDASEYIGLWMMGKCCKVPELGLGLPTSNITVKLSSNVLSNEDLLRFCSFLSSSSRSFEDPGVNEYNSRLRNKCQEALLLQLLGETSISLARKAEFLVWLLTSMVSRVRFPAQSSSRSTSLRKDRGFLCLFFLQVCFGFGERSSNNGSEESRGGRHGTNRDEAAADWWSIGTRG
jgi:hypothetical protein